MGDLARDLASGTAGGAAQLICGHPFDTIKVLLQSQSIPSPGQSTTTTTTTKYSGSIHAVKKLVATDGLRGLYNGMGAPLATVAATSAILFAAKGQMEALLRSEPGVPLSITQQTICGAGAGLAISFITCPAELIKCRLQAPNAVLAVKYEGSRDVIKHTLRSKLGMIGLFKGLIPTMAREVPGNAAMFGGYEAVKQYMAGGRDTSQLGPGSLILAGGLSGAFSWLFVYPTDVVKSVIQIDDYRNPQFSGSIDAFRKIRAAEGIRGLYKGFGPAMIRSIPSNAACFLVYEITRSYLE